MGNSIVTNHVQSHQEDYKDFTKLTLEAQLNYHYNFMAYLLICQSLMQDRRRKITAIGAGGSDYLMCKVYIRHGFPSVMLHLEE